MSEDNGEKIEPQIGLPIPQEHINLLTEESINIPGAYCIVIKIPGWDKVYKITRQFSDVDESFLHQSYVAEMRERELVQFFAKKYADESDEFQFQKYKAYKQDGQEDGVPEIDIAEMDKNYADYKRQLIESTQAVADRLNNSDSKEELGNYAKTLQERHRIISGYLGDHLPKLYGIALVDSPRKFLESQVPSQLVRGDSFLDTIPENGYSVLELHENIGINLLDTAVDLDRQEFEQGVTRSSLENKANNVRRIYEEDEIFKNQMADFARGAKKLYEEKGIVLDLLQDGQIPAKVFGEHQFLDLKDWENDTGSRKENTFLEPKNVSYDGKRVVMYDLSPIYDKNELNQKYLDNYIGLLDYLSELSPDSNS